MEQVVLKSIRSQMRQVNGLSLQRFTKASHIWLIWSPSTRQHFLLTWREQWVLFGWTSAKCWTVYHSLLLDKSGRHTPGRWYTKQEGNWLMGHAQKWSSMVFTPAGSLWQAETLGIDAVPHITQHLHTGSGCLGAFAPSPSLLMGVNWAHKECFLRHLDRLE